MKYIFHSIVLNEPLCIQLCGNILLRGNPFQKWMKLETIKCLKYKNGQTEQTNTFSNSKIETVEQGEKYVQN